MNKLKLIKPIHIPIVLLILAGAFMVGLTDFLAGDLTLDSLRTYEFWNNLITTNVGVLAMILAVILITVDNYTTRNEEYLVLKNYIFEFYLKKYAAPIFKMFLTEENRTRKINEYRLKLQTQYDILFKRATQKNLDVFYGKDENLKLKNRFCIKEKRLATKLNKDQMEIDIDKLNIPYDQITESLIFSGVHSNKIVANRFVVKNKAKKVASDLLPKFILTMAISILSSIFIPDLKEGVMIYPIAVKLFIISTQIYFAVDYARNVYCTQIVLDEIEFRHSVLTSFEMWVKKNIKRLEEI
jgi:hypothetical protein